MYDRHNLHESINFAALRLPPDQAQKALARDIIGPAQYPELEQVHHREGGKTYLFVLDHGDRDGTGLVSDVAVLDFETGRFTVIPREEVTGEEPWFRS